MSRRADPARIDEARRQAVRSRLIGAGLPDSHVDAWIEAWTSSEDAAKGRQDSDFWERGFAWVEAQRAAKRRLPS